MTTETRIISEFMSDDRSRTAKVIMRGWVGHTVEMYENNNLVESRDIDGHTVDYVEDCADNFVRKIGEFK